MTGLQNGNVYFLMDAYCMYLNSLKLVLVYSTPKLFHKCKEDWKESVLAKGILKEFLYFALCQVAQTGEYCRSVSGGNEPLTTLWNVVRRKYIRLVSRFEMLNMSNSPR